MSKCAGCGILLQNDDALKEGYTKNLDNKFCERCFRIKNYNEYQIVDKTNDDFTNVFKEIEKSRNLVLLLVDILDLDSIKDLELTNDVVLVITKSDVWPTGISDKNILNIKTKLNVVDKIVISSLKNYNLDELLSKIKKHQKSKNVYVVGFTNAGKSTMINKFLKNYSEKDDNLTVSAMPSTTLDMLKIPIDNDLTIIDTPGLIEEGSIYNIASSEMLKKIIPASRINPKIYQVKVWQSIVVSDIFRIDAADNNLLFVMSNALTYDRFYKKTDRLENLNKITLNVKENSDIVITGLGFIKVKKAEVIDIYIDKRISVYTRKSLI